MMFLHVLAAAAPLQAAAAPLQEEHQSSLQQQQAQGPRVLYYFTHIPKAAGSSFLMDVEGTAVQMDLCGDTQCYPGMESNSWTTTLTVEGSLQDRADEWQREECTVIGCEGGRVANQRVVGERAKPTIVRDLLLLRNPVEQVLSMFEMCSVTGTVGAYNSSAMTADVETLERWLTAVETYDTATAYQLCYYRPNNLETTSLVAADVNNMVGPNDLEAAVNLVREQAYFVGIVENYSLSICLLGAMVHGLDAVPEGCTCEAAEKQAELGGKVEPNVRDEANDDHGTSSNKVTPSDAALASINRLTALDSALYREAVSRFEGDVRRSGLGCWLDLAKP